MGFAFCPKMFLEFLSTHLHCVLFEYFYDKTLLCCVTVCSLMSSCATNFWCYHMLWSVLCSLLLYPCRWLQRRRLLHKRLTKGRKWIIPDLGLPNILRDTLNFIRRLLSSKRDLWIWLIWRTTSFLVVFRTKVGTSL